MERKEKERSHTHKIHLNNNLDATGNTINANWILKVIRLKIQIKENEKNEKNVKQ